jgi:hypothetical protein
MGETAAIAEFFHMTEGEKLFNEVVARCFDRWRFILSFRITSKVGMKAAIEEIAAQKVTFVTDILQGSDYDKVILDKAAFFKANPPEKIVANMTEQTISETEMAMNAASLVFAHSVLDAAAFDYCRVTALVAPTDWESAVEKRTVPLVEIRGSDYDRLLQQKLKEYFTQLERESLLTKADQLFARCKPPEKWNPMNNYVYDRGRLEKLDKHRHGVIHGETLGKDLRNADDEIDYMMRTALFYMGLVNLRYGLQINPLYTFQAMADLGKTM